MILNFSCTNRWFTSYSLQSLCKIRSYFCRENDKIQVIRKLEKVNGKISIQTIPKYDKPDYLFSDL